VRVWTPSGPAPPDAIGLQLAPTHAARRFELRLDRGPHFHGASLRCKLVFAGPGGVRDETDVIPYPLKPAPAVPLAPGDPDPLQRPPGAQFRVLVWNVAGAALLDRPEPFRRIFSALGADLVLLDEVSERASAVMVARLLGPGWRAVFGSSGGRQRCVVASRQALTRAPALERIAYPPEHEHVLREAASQGNAPEALARAHASGVPTVGAVVDLAGRRLLAAPLDLQCCGNRPGGPLDRLRVLEADAIHAGLKQALAESGAQAVVAGGDFNLVASRAPLDRLAEGLDPGGRALSVASPLQLNGLSNATWRRPGSSFPPGRLDHLLYSESSLRLLRSFVFQTADLSPALLRRYRLEPGDSAASDHLPLVADFAWRPGVRKWSSMERLRIVVAALSLLLIAQIIRSVRREHIRVEYSMTWLGAALLLLAICLSDAATSALGRWIGVPDAPLVLIILAGVLFVFTFFRYSLVVSGLKDHNIQLAQRVGMLEWEIERLQQKLDSRTRSEDPL
jgi:hypothetical protein